MADEVKYVLDALAAAGGVLIAAAVLASLRAALSARDTARAVHDLVTDLTTARTRHYGEHEELEQRVKSLELWRAAVASRVRKGGRGSLPL